MAWRVARQSSRMGVLDQDARRLWARLANARNGPRRFDIRPLFLSRADRGCRSAGTRLAPVGPMLVYNQPPCRYCLGNIVCRERAGEGVELVGRFIVHGRLGSNMGCQSFSSSDTASAWWGRELHGLPRRCAEIRGD